jgi:iron complex outermembrane recepter protein
MLMMNHQNLRVTSRAANQMSAPSLIALAIASLGLCPAEAQTTPSSPADVQHSSADTQPAEMLNDIVVTAQRRSQRLQDIPLAVTALSGAALDSGAISNIMDLQTAAPNVNISLRSGAGVVNIRGIGYDVITAGADGSVAIHSDGVYQSRPAIALSALFDVDRIEIARGPQGTLYGRNATGGAVNLISRKPTSESEGYINASYGNYNALSVEGAISGPIAGDVLTARIAAKVEENDGFGTNIYNGKGIDDLKSRAIRASLDFRPNSTVDLLLVGEYFKRDDSAGAFHIVGCVTTTCNAFAATNRGYSLPANPWNVNEDQQAGYRPEQSSLVLTAKVKLPFADLTSISGYRDGSSYFIADLDGTAQPSAFITREENYKTFSQELQLGRSGEAVDWIIGAYYFHEKNYARANGHFPLFAAPTASIFFQGGTQFTDAYAAFGELSYHATSSLTLTVGGRYSNEKRRLENEFTFTNGPINMVARQAAPTAAIPCVTCRGLTDTAKFNSFTPKVSAQYKIDPRKMLYVTAQKGFKSGGFAIGAVTPAFVPETIWSYEAGLKADWFDRALTTNISAYHYDYKNLQVGRVGPSLATVIDNAASAKIDGVEVEFRLKAGEHLSFDGFGAYNRARFTSYFSFNPNDPSQNPDLSGNLLSNAPKWTGKIGAEYGADAWDGRLTLRGEIFTSSRVFFSPYNNVRNSQAAYTLGNMSLRYEGSGAWSASIYVNNVTDRLVRAGSSIGNVFVGRVITVSYLPPRVYGIKVGRKF